MAEVCIIQTWNLSKYGGDVKKVIPQSVEHEETEDEDETFPDSDVFVSSQFQHRIQHVRLRN